MTYITLYHRYVDNCVQRVYVPHSYDVWVRLGMPAGIASAED